LRAVLTCVLEHLSDVAALVLLEGRPARAVRAGCAQLEHLRRQVAWCNLGVVGQGNRPLDDVLELTDVPGEGVVLQGAQRLGGEAYLALVELLAETAKATGASLRLSTDRYLAGLDDYLPVLTAQRADADTRSRLIAAQRQLLADRISLARALGGGWMLNQMNSRVQIEKDKLQ